MPHTQIETLRSYISVFKMIKDLGLTPLEISVVCCMLLDRRPWNLSSLSNTTGYSRTAIRKMLRSAVSSRWVERKPTGGYALTSQGVETFDHVISDLQNVYRKKGGGLSPHTLALLNDLPPFKGSRRDRLERTLQGAA